MPGREYNTIDLNVSLKFFLTNDCSAAVNVCLSENRVVISSINYHIVFVFSIQQTFSSKRSTTNYIDENNIKHETILRTFDLQQKYLHLNTGESNVEQVYISQKCVRVCTNISYHGSYNSTLPVSNRVKRKRRIRN